MVQLRSVVTVVFMIEVMVRFRVGVRVIIFSDYYLIIFIQISLMARDRVRFNIAVGISIGVRVGVGVSDGIGIRVRIVEYKK
jgi:hypothetical protein